MAEPRKVTPTDRRRAVGNALSRQPKSVRRPVADTNAPIVVDQCWGCNRLRAPKLWASPILLKLLGTEGRLSFREWLCGRPECEGTVITNGGRRG